MKTAIVNGAVVSSRGCLREDLLLLDGRVEAALPPGRLQAPDAERVDATGLYILPGVIDSHIHGCFGTEFDGREPIEAAARRLAARGVTAFLPTVSPAAHSDYVAALEAFKRMSLPEGSARMLGVHIEGPYVSPARRGAIPASAIRPVDMKALRRIVDAGEGLLRIMTVAPEIPGAAEAIAYLAGRGVVPSMGHSAATYAEASAAALLGAARTTHTYNAMNPLHHREPGLLGFTLLDGCGYAELITDFLHVSRKACELLIRTKGADRVVAVSDSLRHGGESLPDGTELQDGTARGGAVYEAGGTLCGSLRVLSDDLGRLAGALGLGLTGAARLLSVNCARSLDLDMGDIAAGMPADLMLVDSALEIRAVYAAGYQVK